MISGETVVDAIRQLYLTTIESSITLQKYQRRLFIAIATIGAKICIKLDQKGITKGDFLTNINEIVEDFCIYC